MSTISRAPSSAPDGAALPARQARAADDRRRDDVELVPGRVGARRRSVEARAHERRQAGRQAGHDEDDDLHPPDWHAREAARFGVPADGKHVPPANGLDQIDAARHGHEDHHQHRDRVERIAETERRLRDAGERPRQQDALGVARHERDAAHDPHRAERDDERVHAEPDDQRAVDRAAGEADAERDREPERDRRRRDRARRRRAAPSPSTTPGQRVDGADGQIDAAGDDHDRGADGHDREEAGVGRRLDEGVRVEKVVDRRVRTARRRGIRRAPPARRPAGGSRSRAPSGATPAFVEASAEASISAQPSTIRIPPSP